MRIGFHRSNCKRAENAVSDEQNIDYLFGHYWHMLYRKTTVDG